MRRNIREYERVLASIYAVCVDSSGWTPDEHRRIELFTRYKTTAERSFQRAHNVVEQIRKNRFLEQHRRAQLDLALAKEARLTQREHARVEEKRARTEGQAKKPIKAAPPERVKLSLNSVPLPPLPPTLRQYIDVQVEDGQTVTSFYPSNDELLEQSKTMQPPPKFVWRQVTFSNGIPPGYRWIENECHEYEPAELQRPFDNWLTVLDREKLSGHISPLFPSSLDPPGPTNLTEEKINDEPQSG